jgi:hypothetical protein
MSWRTGEDEVEDRWTRWRTSWKEVEDIQWRVKDLLERGGGHMEGNGRDVEDRQKSSEGQVEKRWRTGGREAEERQ